MRKILSTNLLLFFFTSLYAQTVSKYIVVDQFGYRPVSQKVAVIRDPQVGSDAGESFTPGATYKVVNATTKVSVFQGAPTIWNSGTTDPSSGDKCWWFDFSSINTVGKYYILDVSNNVKTYDFEIREDIYTDILKQTMRFFFYQRRGYEKLAKYAGAGWADGASHMGTLQDTDCRLYSDPTNAATSRNLMGGWYDAGDVNKYTLPTAGYVSNLLNAYRENTKAWGDDYNIPESGNGIPDVIDEARWGMDYLLRLQETNGSCIPTVGTLQGNLENLSPPTAGKRQSVYVLPSTSATLAAASAFSIGAIVFAQFDKPYADKLKASAIKAYNWSVLNPSVVSRPTIYIAAGDGETDDDGRYHLKMQADVHLFELTADTKYRDDFENNYQQLPLFKWFGFVDQYRAGLQETLMQYVKLSGATPAVVSKIKTALINAYSGSGNYLGKLDSKADPYMAYIGAYNWGSVVYKGTYGAEYMDMIKADLFPTRTDFLRQSAENILHNVHGVNPFNLVYITNMGAYGAEKSASTIFHSWFKDGSAKWDQVGLSTYGPPPGFLPGGPNSSYNWDDCCLTNCFGNTTQCYAEPIPKNQPPQKSYKDFNTGFPLNSWSLTEPSCGYQSSYIRLLSKFVDLTSVNNNIPIAIPGTIEAENYDKGSEGISFHDTDVINEGGKYRTDGVDVGISPLGGFMVGWTATGEWMDYTVKIASAGNYDFEMTSASVGGAAFMSIDLDGTPVKTNIPFPKTVDWNTYVTSKVTIALPAGKHVLRLNVQEFGFNLDKIVVKASLTTGVDSEIANAQIAIYPNPSQDGIFSLTDTFNWKAYTVLGEELKSGIGNQINLSEYPKGIYLIKMEDKIQRVVKE